MTGWRVGFVVGSAHAIKGSGEDKCRFWVFGIQGQRSLAIPQEELQT